MTFPKRIAQNIMKKPDIVESLSFEPLELYSERDLYVIMLILFRDIFVPN